MISKNITEIQILLKRAIESNNLEKFKNILIDNNILISDINSESFDVLIFAIEKKTSFEFIKYIIPFYNSLNYYILTKDNEYISPLFAAVAERRSSIIQLLLKCGADIDYKVDGKRNGVIILFYQNCIKNNMKNEIQEKKTLKCLLNNGFDPSISFIDLLLSDSKYASLLKLLFEHKFYSIFNSTFILHLLLIYKRQVPLSNSKLKDVLLEKFSEFKIKKEWFRKDRLLKNNMALQILSWYTQSNPDFSMELIQDLYLSKNYELLKILIPAYFNINLRNKENKSLFDIASYNLNTEMMIYLIENGAEIDYNNLYIDYKFVNKLIEINYPNIMKIIDRGQYPKVSFDCEKENKSIQLGYILLQAIYSDNNELSKYLVDKGANIHINYCNFKERYLINHYSHAPKSSSNITTNEYINPLIQSILKGNEAMVNYLISKGTDVNKYGIIGKSFCRRVLPINCAIKIKNKNIIKYLVEHGAYINSYSERIYDENEELPLEYAIRENSVDMVEFLIKDCGAEVNVIFESGYTPLILAISKGNIEIVKILINHGADINMMKNSDSPLNLAIARNMEDIVHYLVEKGANIYKSSYSMTPLMNAVYYCNNKIAFYLIEKGADINKSFIYHTSPLLFAIKSCNKKFVKYLIEKYNVDVNSSFPIMKAIELNNKTIVKYLVEAGADISKAYNNHTPLSLAITCNAKCITRYLVEQGVNMDEWPHVESPIVYAIKNNKMAIAKCLVDCGLTLTSPEINKYFNRKNSKA
eukprot:jgi/Orpsp1_1/1185953/evm.model.c7180000096210.1